MSDEFDCDIVANNDADFVIANNVKSGYVPILLRGAKTLVSNMNFDVDTCCQKNDMFRVKLKKAQENLRGTSSDSEKFALIQSFIEDAMPWCQAKDEYERTACIFDGEPFSYMVDHKYCMCAERASMAQYLCQQSGIKSYLVNSIVEISSGEKGEHAYVVFEKDNQMYVYDPANPMKDKAPRVMDTNMDKTIFGDFMAAVNENSDVYDRKKKNCVGFNCRGDDGKKFVYRSYCGTIETLVSPSRLKAARAAKVMQNQNNASKNDKGNE